MDKLSKKEYDRQRYLANRKKILERASEYRKEHKLERAESNKKYVEKNSEKIKEYKKQYYQNNKRKISEKYKEYYSTKLGRALKLIGSYKHNDEHFRRGDCTLTAEWVIDNIFAKSCVYCGENDWLKLGCDRIDNDKPHTPENVVPCCAECNRKRGQRDFDTFVGLFN